jgi:hypothetical protein
MKTYRVAGRHLQAEIDCRFLAPLEIQPSSPSRNGKPGKFSSVLPAKLVYHGPGWVAGFPHRVKCTLSNAGYRLEIAGVGAFSVALDGTSFSRTGTDPRVDAAHLSHTALGPPLILALALQGVFCLHASGVTHQHRTIAFVGHSGAGKSSLARLLAERPEFGWRRLADDTLAVEASFDRPTARTHFPQLKLGEEEQPWLHLPEKLPLAAIYLLDRETNARVGSTGVELRCLSPRDATMALLHHTMAGRLFGPALVERHLDFCAKTANDVPVRRLTYPFRPEALPEISDALLGCFEE